ncbi:MAG TPA: hypothetical protein VFY84_04830 [Jiangellales bacterium]|nr:hypothetical protein [Jiangellales bacterium]
MADYTAADVIGCPACRTILNAKTAGCAGPWHADNRTADPVSHTDADIDPTDRLRAMLHQISWHAADAASHPDGTVEQLRAELRRIAAIAGRIAEEGHTDA